MNNFNELTKELEALEKQQSDITAQMQKIKASIANNLDWSRIDKNTAKELCEEVGISVEDITKVVILNSTASISNYAFCDCTGLKGIAIPDSVTSIGDHVFVGCK